jgi:predicted RNA binding protein YcfA (HicA-like mRNA interferase family)
VAESRKVSKWEKFRSKILSGQCDGNINFAELVNYLQRCGFDLRTRGSHNLFTKNGIDALINLQSDGSTAKRYQVRQIRDILIKYQIDQPKEAANE